MAEIDPVILELRAENARYRADLRSSTQLVTRELGQQERAVQRLERQFSRAGSAMASALAGVATIATAREILRLVDAGKQIEAQLRLATRESGSFAKAQEDVRRIAMSTRSGLEETAQLYATFQRTSLQLGITQEQSARATETVTKAFQISGASAAEAAGGLRQFLQGLQSGALRGEELNSVLENAPRLAKLLADGLGVTVGQLRALGAEGDLAADKLINALTNKKFTDGIDAEFRELPVTFDQAMQQVENAATITFSAFDRGGGFSQMLANFVTDGANGFADLEQAAVDTGIDIRSTFEGLANAFDPMLSSAREIFGLIESDARTLADRIRPLLGEIDTITSNARTSFWDSLMPGEQERLPGTNLLERFNEGQAAAERRRRGELGEQFIADMFRGRDVFGNRIAPAVTGGGAVAADKPKRPGRRGPSAEAIAARVERERLQGIRDEGEKQQDLLRVQDDIIAARSALATAAEDAQRFELQQLGIEQAGRLAQLWTQKRIGELTDEEYQVRAAGLAEEINLRRQRAQQVADEAALDQRRDDLRAWADQQALQSDVLQAQADIADTLEQRRFLEQSALGIQQEIERALLEQAIAEGKVADAAQARELLGQRQAAETAGLEKDNQGTLGRYLDDTADPKTAAEEAAVREIQSVRDGLVDGLTEQLGTKNELIKSMLSMFLDQVLFRPIAQALQGAGGGGGLVSLLSAGLTAIGLPGFASGGSMTIGGQGGVDNNTLSLNGQPIARVSRGETLNVSPNQRAARAPTPQINQTFVLDARYGITTPQLLQHVNQTAQAAAVQVGAAVGKSVLKGVPSRLAQYQKDGT